VTTLHDWLVRDVMYCCLVFGPVHCAGYPVLRNKVDFRRTDKAANKEDLNRIVTATKVT